MSKTEFKKAFDVLYEFRVGRHADGNFKNLWKLEMKGPETNDEWLEIVDADHLSTVIGKMAYTFERDGY